MNETRPDPKHLTIYLADHWAGATADAQRAARLAGAEAESADAAALATFADDVAADLDALRTLCRRCRSTSRLRTGLASVAEKVGALKPNGHLTERLTAVADRGTGRYADGSPRQAFVGRRCSSLRRSRNRSTSTD